MKNVIVFGASGRTGRYIIRKMMAEKNVKLTVFVRNAERLNDMDLTDVQVIQGDALNAEDVKKAMDGQDILLTALEGDVLTMAKNIKAAQAKTGVRRIIWMTGMGIHHEITGETGKMLDEYVKTMPEYIEAADLIAAMDINTVLLRCGAIEDGSREDYRLTREGEQPDTDGVTRGAIAKCMADMVADETLGANDSIGINN